MTYQAYLHEQRWGDQHGQHGEDHVYWDYPCQHEKLDYETHFNSLELEAQQRQFEEELTRRIDTTYEEMRLKLAQMQAFEAQEAPWRKFASFRQSKPPPIQEFVQELETHSPAILLNPSSEEEHPNASSLASSGVSLPRSPSQPSRPLSPLLQTLHKVRLSQGYCYCAHLKIMNCNDMLSCKK